MRREALVGALLLSFAWIRTAHAEPWMAPGDESLRSDVQVLADSGILRGPVTTWPLSWPDIARDVLAVSHENVESRVLAPLLRVQRLARVAANRGFTGAGVRASAATEPATLRTFGDSPREEAELAARASWLSDHFALNLQGSYVVDASDGKEWRADGTYLGVNFGNFMVSAGFMERWWGPGWDGSLILSNNARPIPSLTVERNLTDPFKTRWLSWLGNWRASLSFGKAESHDVAVPGVHFFAARLNFKPARWAEFGVSRTAQWCGGERSCDWDAFTDMLLGEDNQQDTADQPGNQLAGYDLRVSSPWHALPVAFYTQWIGEDEAGGLPSKFMGLFGLEGWGATGAGVWRLRAEYADTACDFTAQDPEFGCAYRNSIYPQGYSYRHRILGHTMDNDSRMFTVAGLLTRPNGGVLSLTARRVQLNRDGGEHAISDVPLDYDNVEFRYSMGVGAGKICVGVGYGDPPLAANTDTRIHGFVTWQQGM